MTDPSDFAPAVKKIYDRFQTRLGTKAGERLPDGRLLGDVTHREILRTWVNCGPTPNGNAVFSINYCPACKYGYVVDMVYEAPDGPDARELAIIRKKRWDRVCSVEVEAQRDLGRQEALL